MALVAPPKEKISLFQDVTVHNDYIGVLRPVEEEETNIELPEGAQEESKMKNATARVAKTGSEVEHVERGDKVLVSTFMQEPHQIVERQDEDGEEFHMFILNSDMAVATIHDQKEKVDKVFN